MTRFYHASPHTHAVGTVLEPRPESANFQATSFTVQNAVCLATAEYPHTTIYSEVVADTRPWFVYEVRPLDRVRFGETWSEAHVLRAEVIAIVGSSADVMAEWEAMEIAPHGGSEVDGFEVDDWNSANGYEDDDEDDEDDEDED